MIKNTKKFVYYFWNTFRRDKFPYDCFKCDCLVCRKDLTNQERYKNGMIPPILFLCVGCYKKIEYDLGLSYYEKNQS